MATEIYMRIFKKKVESGMSWDEIANIARIGVSSWMTGLPYSNPTDRELRRLAPVLKTTYEYLKYGREAVND